jgi:small subunit ribosomal protein S7
MPRRREVTRREIIPDPKYNSRLVARFINGILRRGKKSLAESMMYGALDLVANRAKEDPLKIFEQAVENVMPMVEVKSRRVGGSTYQIPVEIRHERRVALSIRWLIQFAKARNEQGMVPKLAGELLDAANRRGGAVKKKEDTHRMAEANRAFAHYRW